MFDNTPGPARREPASCRICGQVHRRKFARPGVAALVCAVVAIVVLAALASGLPDYWRNFALNTAADLLGAAIFLHVIGPIAQRNRNEHHDGPLDESPDIPTPRTELPRHEQNPTDTAVN